MTARMVPQSPLLQRQKAQQRRAWVVTWPAQRMTAEKGTLRRGVSLRSAFFVGFMAPVLGIYCCICRSIGDAPNSQDLHEQPQPSSTAA